MKKSFWVTLIVTVYLVAYSIMSRAGVPENLLLALFTLWPILVGWMVITVLRDTSRPVQELKENEEWGYQDKDKNTLGTF
ncbi:MAG: hypothetical protein ABIN89_15870 [Chitinophagaceae bacterium]